MSEGYSETTYQSWGSRLMDSIKGVLVGGFLFLASFVLLFWNEGNAVSAAKSLAEGEKNVKSVQPDKLDRANDGKLVHMTGTATTQETLADKEFGISLVAIKLRRKVQMYQWKEKKESKTEKRLGGGTETKTTYHYERDWSSSRNDSSRFHSNAVRDYERKNPGLRVENPTMTHTSADWSASAVTLGAFKLSPGLIGKISTYEPLAVSDETAKQLPPQVKLNARVTGTEYYLGVNMASDPSRPQVGDLKIAFEVVKPATVSLVSRQIGETFEPYPAKAGKAIELLQAGTHSPEAMFAAAKAAAAMLTWILRLVGFLMMAFGLFMIANPLVVVADVLPFLGSLLGAGVGLFAGIVSLCLSTLTIAVAWLFYRPLLGAPLLVLAVAGLVLYAKSAARKKASGAAAA